MAAKQHFMRSTTAKVATGLGVAGLATSALNQAIRREDQKAHLAATSGKSMAKVERIWGSVTDNAIATGQSVEKVGQLLQSAQDMGGLLDVGVKTPKAPLCFFSDVMQGTGAAAQDVARMSNILVQAMDVDLKKATVFTFKVCATHPTPRNMGKHMAGRFLGPRAMPSSQPCRLCSPSKQLAKKQHSKLPSKQRQRRHGKQRQRRHGKQQQRPPSAGGGG